MNAKNFTRNDCELGARRVSYAKLQREYRCSECGGRVVMKWDTTAEERRPYCGRCEATDFEHEAARNRRRWQAEILQLEQEPVECGLNLHAAGPEI